MMLRRKSGISSDEFTLDRVVLSKGCIVLHINGTTYDRITFILPETGRIKTVCYTNHSEVITDADI